MADPATKKALQDLVAQDELKNKSCVDCGAPRPQWASIGFAVFICLQCAGTHRGFGVHISFVRSVSMDAWQDDQLRRMKLGGNAPFVDFLRAYPPAESGYTEGMSVYDKYHCWAATQYREKLSAALEDKPWSPSSPPAAVEPAPSTLRKSRASARASSHSPAPSETANERYFASLGASNASRPDDLPPSQGGRYSGFGSTPEPEETPPAGAPTLRELQSDPVRALSRGWGLFARAVSENVVKPGMERVGDPELREKVGVYVSSAGQKASAAAGSANAWGRAQFGVDMGAVVERVREKVGGGGHAGYEAVDQEGEGTSALYERAHEDEFFKDNDKGKESKSKEDNWDEWKDF